MYECGEDVFLGLFWSIFREYFGEFGEVVFISEGVEKLHELSFENGVLVE
jgi:hypothetical protein